MKQGFFSIIFNNFQFKIASLLLASIFWYMIQGDEILEISQKLNIQVDVPEKFIVKEGNTRVRDVTIRGPRALVGDLVGKPPLEARIMLPVEKTGNLRVRVDKEYIRDWDSRKSLTVHDEFLNLVIDEKSSRTVAVKEVLQGSPADGYIIEKIEIKPPNITLNGSKTEVAKIQEILTEAIDITGIQQSKSFEAKIAPLPTSDKIERSVETVTVSLQVGEQKVNKRFDHIPIEVTPGDFIAQVKPRHVSIVIQGTPGVLSFVKQADLRANIDLRDLGPGRYEKEVQAKIPSDTVIIETIPDKINVEVYNQRKIN